LDEDSFQSRFTIGVEDAGCRLWWRVGFPSPWN
jgi:hypothetical protein